MVSPSFYHHSYTFVSEHYTQLNEVLPNKEILCNIMKSFDKVDLKRSCIKSILVCT